MKPLDARRTATNALVAAIASGGLLAELTTIYEDLHRNPELSMREVRTAKLAADDLAKHGYEVTRGLGGTGVVGVLRNGEGPTVMLRADMDALPLTEATGLTYASKVTTRDDGGGEVGVAHACGHDMHVTWLIGAARVLSARRDLWKGTVLALFQPGEELGRGAQAMMDDGMTDRFPKPDVILGQHVMVGPAGTVGYRSGTILSAGDSLEVKLFGRGSHGSQPQASIDPVVMAASAVLRLQTIVSREVGPLDAAVVTIGKLQAGTKENIIPDEAVLALNIRTYNEHVREEVLEAVKRICRAEAAASNAPREPKLTSLSRYPLTENDRNATARVVEVFDATFGERTFEIAPAVASEDFSVFGRRWKVPYVYWIVGGTDAKQYEEAKAKGKLDEIPSNHSPRFAPVLEPTLTTGLQAMLAAASAWLAIPEPAG